MSASVFVEAKFWLLVLFSFVVPVAIYALLLAKRAVSRTTVLALGFALIVVSAFDLYLLQSLGARAKLTPSLVDDTVFLSELTVALYLLPVLFAGVGVNVVSHVLVRHIDAAEARSSASTRTTSIGGAAATGERPVNSIGCAFRLRVSTNASVRACPSKR